MYYLWGHPKRNPLLIFQYLENFGTELGDQILPDSNTDALNLNVMGINVIFVEFIENTLSDIKAEEFTDGKVAAVDVDHIREGIVVRIDWFGHPDDFVELE